MDRYAKNISGYGSGGREWWWPNIERPEGLLEEMLINQALKNETSQQKDAKTMFQEEQHRHRQVKEVEGMRQSYFLPPNPRAVTLDVGVGLHAMCCHCFPSEVPRTICKRGFFVKLPCVLIAMLPGCQSLYVLSP